LLGQGALEEPGGGTPSLVSPGRFTII